MSNQNIDNPYGNNDKEQPSIPFLNKSQSVSPNQSETFEKPARRSFPPRRGTGGSSVLDNLSSSATLTPDMKELVGRIQNKEGILPAISPAQKKLDEQLESVGAYERVGQLRDGDRRRRMLQAYITTPKSAGVIGEEEGIQNPTIAHQLIRSAMDVAFFALPEEQRAADYDNNPEVAWRISAEQKTHTKGERIKKSLDKQRNPDTGKIEFSYTHKRRLKEAHLRRWERERRLRALQAEDQPSAQHDPQDGNTPT